MWHEAFPETRGQLDKSLFVNPAIGGVDLHDFHIDELAGKIVGAIHACQRQIPARQQAWCLWRKLPLQNQNAFRISSPSSPTWQALTQRIKFTFEKRTLYLSRE